MHFDVNDALVTITVTTSASTSARGNKKCYCSLLQYPFINKPKMLKHIDYQDLKILELAYGQSSMVTQINIIRHIILAISKIQAISDWYYAVYC